MKKFLFLLMTAMAVISAQAQTCKISANKNNGKIIHISVNLDSLKGQTLVTTISQKAGGNVDVQMAYEGKDSVMAQEYSTASAVNFEEEVAVADTTEVVAPNLYAPEEEVAEAEAVADSTATPKSEDELLSGAIFKAFGLNEVASLIGSITKTNGEPYAEYYAKKWTEADTTKYIPQYKPRKWGWLKNYKSYPTLEFSGIFGKDYGGDDKEGADEIDSEDYGTDPDNSYNYGGSIKLSQVFVHGHYDENGNFVPNKLNFGWSVGALYAMDYQKDYGWSYDIMAKVGIQAGNGITLGVDALVGAGVTPYAIYSTNYVDYRVIMHNQWCFKYGLQAWVSMNYGGNTYTTMFARLVKSVAPSSVYNHPTAQHWENTYIDFDDGSWHVGFAVGYKFGYSSDLKDRRLIATVSTGYSLLGEEKAQLMLIELEKYNNVSPKLDFLYGLGYGTSFGKDKLQTFVLNGGWRIRPKETSKFAYLAKFYAGVGEIMVEKRVADAEHHFDMTNTAVRQLAAKAGVHLGATYQLGCFNLNALLRCGYHYGFETEYNGYSTTEVDGLRGFDLTPTLGISYNF